MTQDQGQAEIVDSGGEIASKMRAVRAKRGPTRPRERPGGWEPYGNAPKGIRRRYRKQLAECHRRPTVAIKLFCIECLGYSGTEPKLCEAKSCVFWAYNRRIFGGEK